MKFSIVDAKTKTNLPCTVSKNTDDGIELSVQTDCLSLNFNQEIKREFDFIYLSDLKSVLNLDWYTKYMSFVSYFVNDNVNGLLLNQDLIKDLDETKLNLLKELVKQFKTDFDKRPIMSLDQLTSLYLPTFLEIFKQ